MQESGLLESLHRRYVFAIYSHQTGELLDGGKWEGVVDDSAGLTSNCRFDWSDDGLAVMEGFYGKEGMEYTPLIEAEFSRVKWKNHSGSLSHDSR